MSDPVNLRQARKTRERARKCRQADENAAKYGRSKAQRKLEAARQEKARAALDAHKREDE